VGVSYTPGDQSVGEVVMLRTPGLVLSWVGLDSSLTGSPAAVTSGSATTAGTKIVYIDYHHGIYVEAAAGQIQRRPTAG
jgi:hypothetical protein